MSSATAQREGILDRAKGAVADAGQAVGNAATSAGRSVDRAVGAVGSGMESLADTARKNLPHEGVMGTAAKYVADGLEAGGHYVEQKRLSGMAGDVGALIKSHPIPSVLLGLGIGYLICRAFKD